MSLTGYITGRDHQEVRTRFKIDFTKPTFPRPHPELKAPPLTKNYGLIGTAFDYLFRFHLEYHNKSTIVCREEWIADHAFEGFAFRLGVRLQHRHKREIPNKIVREDLEKFRLVRNQFIRAKLNYRRFIEYGVLTDELVADCLFLAKLDIVMRAGLVAQLFEAHEAKDLVDLKRLISIVDFSNFVAIKRCYLNPVFGKASELVGGADCDIILDDALIEVKVIQDFQLRREHFNQLIGYYILSLIGGVNTNSRTRPIRKIGIYFARHGVLWLVELSDIGNPQKFAQLKNWFFDYVNRVRTERAERFRLTMEKFRKNRKNVDKAL
ncbi:MAG TPA: hypothetical protein VGO50_05405 [Pyrinomonadaceae bacterium]|jgi:hypothetical protein|nr:hypothetical protein [Pyrinomonadaceae bacterium]